MKEFKYTITDPEGIHARPAGELVKVCKEFACKITLTKDGKTADCKKIFGLMGLAVKKEQEVVVTFDGEDEDAAYTKVSAFLEENVVIVQLREEGALWNNIKAKVYLAALQLDGFTFLVKDNSR